MTIDADNLNPEARERVYRVACYVGYADETITPKERTLLEELRASLELAPEDAERLEAEAQQGVNLQIGANEDEAVAALKVITRVMVVDGSIDPREAEYLNRIGKALGASDDLLAKVLRGALHRQAKNQ